MQVGVSGNQAPCVASESGDASKNEVYSFGMEGPALDSDLVKPGL